MPERLKITAIEAGNPEPLDLKGSWGLYQLLEGGVMTQELFSPLEIGDLKSEIQANIEKYRKEKDPLEMPVKAIPLMQSYHDDDGKIEEIDKKLADVVVGSELVHLDSRLEDQKQTIGEILKGIVADSANKYWREGDEEHASEAGIERADRLVSLVLGKEASAISLGGRVSLDDLIGMVTKNIPGLDGVPFNQEIVKQKIIENIPQWYEESQKEAIDTILNRESSLSSSSKNPETLALELAVMGVHDSWAGMQARRSAWDTNQQESYQRLIEALNILYQEEDAVEMFPELRIFRPTFRPLAIMEQDRFVDGFERGTIEEGIALAVLEIMNDLVHFV